MSAIESPAFVMPSDEATPMTLDGMLMTSRILHDYLNLMRVQINNSSPTFMLETPNPKLMFDLPTTAELMQRCLAVNPFEAKFREANQKISSGAMPPTSAATQSIEALEANGPLPISGSGGLTDLLLKIPPSSLQQSPGIFSNISILAADNNDGQTHENLKTADISKLLSAAGDSSAQAPRTADVLNAVLDMHSDRLHTINYLNKPDFSKFLRSPSSSAPNSASILGSAMCVPSTSCSLLAPPPPPVKPMSTSFSPNQNLAVPDAMLVSGGSSAQRSPAAPGGEINGHDSKWEHPSVKKEIYYDDHSMISMDRASVSASGSDREVTPLRTEHKGVGRPPNSGRGRGRGRSTTADMQPDERRNTILERNKAAAVRYRKRKKEEHDDMIGRVHLLEQEKNTLMTQNQVLRRELERVTAVLAEREQRCVCLKGVPLDCETQNGVYCATSQPQLMNLNPMQNGGMAMKRPKM
ncbi:unnamed protein product [Caenorhabditis bovis]|uniref:BZIP domain-containing protein n=1 Tax=Caenorhabditis bovis TaxID=2654633 RepID=A0A8S1ETI1_9PELO|nr:unnamed protein product [Caenorhabditis bovis]